MVGVCEALIYASQSGVDCTQLVEAIRADIAAWRQDAAQFDDLTLVVLEAR